MNKFLKILKSSCGQSTLEFAIVTAALLIIVITIGTLWNMLDQGLFVEHALRSASHHLQEAAAGIIGDVFSC